MSDNEDYDFTFGADDDVEAEEGGSDEVGVDVDKDSQEEDDGGNLAGVDDEESSGGADGAPDSTGTSHPARGRGATRGRGGRGGRGSGAGRGGSQLGKSRWSYQNWVRLAHAVTEDSAAFKLICQPKTRTALDTGVNPWDTVASLYNSPDFKPEAHKVAAQHPDCRSAAPATLDPTPRPAGELATR